MTIKSVFDKLGEKPPAADLVGWSLIDFDKEARWAKVGFEGRDAFKNPTGFIQGGFLAAMLDELMGTAVIISTDAGFIPTTISITVDYVRPARPGPLVGESKVTSLGKSLAFLEGRLIDEPGKLIARANSTCRLTAMDPDWLVNADPTK